MLFYLENTKSLPRDIVGLLFAVSALSLMVVVIIANTIQQPVRSPYHTQS
ncbi:MAG: hypothetical protein ABR999_09450 [Methanoregula sp.]|jgi:hypothetical protein